MIDILRYGQQSKKINQAFLSIAKYSSERIPSNSLNMVSFSPIAI